MSIFYPESQDGNFIDPKKVAGALGPEEENLVPVTNTDDRSAMNGELFDCTSEDIGCEGRNQKKSKAVSTTYAHVAL